MTFVGRAAARLYPTLPAMVATPALAAERSALSVVPEWIAMGVMVVGGLVFFAWVVWLAFHR